MSKLSEEDVELAERWRGEAEELAQDAHENRFESHHGLVTLLDPDGSSSMCCYYNNSPWAVDGPPYDRPDSHRGRELAAFRVWLRDQPDIRELACASYPEDGYTIALLMQATPESAPKIQRQWKLITSESIRSISERRGLRVVRS